jgi:hypothetical protein
MRLLSLVVRATVILLAASAVLVVLGIFNSTLRWDIFSPEVEKFLYGVFGSCVALGAFGAAITLVLGIHEVVAAFRRLLDHREPEAAPARPASRWRYLAAMAGLLVLLVITVASFSAANRRVQAHRLEVFKLIARDQMRQLGDRLAEEVARIPAPCETCATPRLAEIFRTMEGLSFCRGAVLYLPDPSDEAVLWRYPSRQVAYASAGQPARFERFFIARDDDRAVKLALAGDRAWLEQKNRDPAFLWYHFVRGPGGRTRGVLEILGNDSESFREYEYAAVAAEARQREGAP